MRPAAQRAEQGIPGPSLSTSIINVVTVGTAASTIWESRGDQVIDFLVQNLSTTRYVYIVQTETSPITEGIRVPRLGYASMDNWLGDLVLKADGAGANVRYFYQPHGLLWYGSG